MDFKCLRCDTPLSEDYQLIFDETGIELQLDKLLVEYFEIFIVQDSSRTQALCEQCVSKLTELYDLTQKNQELQSSEKYPISEEEEEPVHFKEEQELIIEDSALESEHGETQINENSNSLQDNDEFLGFDDVTQGNITNFENVQYLEEFEGIIPHKYVREVIKTELEEITYEQNTVCRLCDEVLKSHTAVLMHVSTNHETTCKKYPCIMCDKVDNFESIKDLAFHIVLKHYDLEIINIYCMCPECGKRFSDFIEYNKHSCYLQKAGSRLLQECTTCMKKFSSNKRYRFHLQFHLEKRRPKACFICDILFSNENDLFEHIMYAHEKEDALICKKCDRICTSKKLYDSHMELHNAVRSYHCEFCPKSYLYKQMLMNHTHRHHLEEQSNKCKICKKTLASKHLLTRHMQLKHLRETEENVYVCYTCGLVGATDNDTMHHANNVCPYEDPTRQCLKIAYACEFCEVAYDSVKNLKAHRKIHRNNQYICWICQCVYTEYKKLKTHIITHKMYEPIQKTFPINRHYVCDFESCEQSYLTWPSLRAHKARHAADAKFTCKVCSQTFRTRSQLNAHLKAHDNNEEYPCQFCSKLCSSHMSLSVHIARKHNNNYRSCPTCKATYNSEEALKEHIDANHVELKCEYCDKVTKNKRNLEIHIQIVHIKVKRFFCSTCNKGYYNCSDLKVHERAAHAEAKKFKCQHCDFSSSYEASFNAHILMHASKKPFKCDECSREFTRKTCFKLHLLRHSDIKPFSCPYGDCGRSFVTRGILNSHLRDMHPELGLNVKKTSPRERQEKRKRTAKQPKKQPVIIPNTSSPVKYEIMELETENNAVKMENTDGGLVFFDESNTEQEVVLECIDEESDLIVDLNQSEDDAEYTRRIMDTS